MKAHTYIGSTKIILIALLLLGGLTVSAVTYADSILPAIGFSEGSLFSALSRTGPTTTTAQVSSTPSVTTDQEEYAPGQIVTISGSGFAPGANVDLLIVHIAESSASKISAEGKMSYDHSGHTTWSVPVGADGTFSSTWLVGNDCYGATLLLTADQGGLHAETTFRDAIGFNKGVYNKDDFPPDSTGKWTSGNAGDHYLEGQWVSYQYQVAGIGSGNPTPSFDISFNHYQQNVDAIFIDAFANFRACVDCTEDSDVTQGGNDGNGVGMLLHDIPYPSTSTTNWKSAISAISLINGTLDANGQCVATEDPVNTPSQEHCFHVDGAALQSLFPGTNFSSGNHTITLFYEAHLAASRTWRNGKQYLLGCPTSIHYVAPGPEVIPANTVYGTQAYSGGDPCALDNSGDWTDSIQGVGFATGSSRQFNIINQTAGSQGALSLPIPSVEAPTGSITIVKVTQPSPAVGAPFGFTGDLGEFTLDTDPSATNSHTITFNDIPANTPFAITESSMPSDWALTNIACTVSSGGSQSTDVDTATATVSLPSTDGASATCTFTNTNDNLLNGRIIVVKQTTPDDDPQEFTFTPSYNGGATFNLSDGESNDSCEGGQNCLPANIYTVVETVPADWELTSATCTSSLGDPDSGPGAIDLRESEVVTCTFNNTKLTPTLTVTKTPSATAVCNGSSVEYTYVVTNTGPLALSNVDLVDDVLGSIVADTTLAVGESKEYKKSGTINGEVTNTVTATADSVGGQTATDTASATVTGYVCTISVTKEPDNTAVCNGSTVGYTITVTNNSPQFAWTGNVVDDVLGTLATDVTIPASGNVVYTPSHAINGEVTNTVTATGAFGDVDATAASASDNATVNGYVCTIDVEKSVDAENVCIGARVNYTVRVTNTGNFFTFSGTVTDTIAGSLGSVSLAPGASQEFTYSSEIGAGVTVNTATATGTFNDGSATQASDDASASVTGNICRIVLVKQVLPETDNTSAFDFNSVGTDTLFDGVQLADDGQAVRDVTTSGPFSIVETVPAGWDLIDRVCVNQDGTVRVNATADITGPDTTLGTVTVSPTIGETITCTFTNRERGKTTLLKLTNGVEDPEMEWHFTLTGPGVNASDSTPPPLMDFGGVTLTPGATYTICEVGIPPTWTVEWKVDTDGDGIPDTIIPFVPNVSNSPIPPGGFYGGVYDPNWVAYPGQYVNDTRCVNFTVQPGQTLAFEVNNSMPGGDPRTIGYWKNWNTCTGGGQVAAAAANGGPEAGWFLLDDLLLSPGYHLGPASPGGLHLDGNDQNALLKLRGQDYVGPDCEAAVEILDKSDVVTGKKMASDGAYNMAAQLLAAMLNYSAGAETCQAASNAINGASQLLIDINFNGTGTYLKKGALYNQANAFAYTLDQYNNGNLCP